MFGLKLNKRECLFNPLVAVGRGCETQLQELYLATATHSYNWTLHSVTLRFKG